MNNSAPSENFWINCGTSCGLSLIATAQSKVMWGGLGGISQNQALCVLVFTYRYLLKRPRDFDKLLGFLMLLFSKKIKAIGLYLLG
ncbi:MAG: hypothetical protein RLZZ435_1844 [Cyanobacteriota bacterium]|jgi:hypothetical protein